MSLKYTILCKIKYQNQLICESMKGIFSYSAICVTIQNKYANATSHLV